MTFKSAKNFQYAQGICNELHIKVYLYILDFIQH